MYRMTMNRPSSWWGGLYRESIPLGNGLTGAMVYGGAVFERIVLTHARCWRGAHAPELPDVSACMPEMQRAILSGRMPEGDRMLADALKAAGYRPTVAAPVPVCELRVTTPARQGFRRYRRALDMENACAEVRYLDGDATYRRRCFVSRTADVLALEISSDAPLTDVQISLCLPECAGSVRENPQLLVQEARSDRLSFAAALDGEAYGAAARIIRREGRILVLAKVFPDGDAQEQLRRLHAELEALPADWDALLTEHVPAHRALFDRSRFELEDERFSDETLNSELLDDAYESGRCPNRLTERMWAYGRYLLVSATREGGLPCPLLGLWSGEYGAGWSFNMANINLEMIYWEAVGGCLPELMLPVFDYYDAMLPAMRRQSRRLYGCSGIWLNAVTAPGPEVCYANRHILNWSGGAAWVSRIYYDYWLLTRDEEFLRRRLWPFLMETAAFYRDFLRWEGERWTIVPSVSPENQPSAYRGEGALNGSQGCVNATMDIALIRELFLTIRRLLPQMGEDASLEALCDKILRGSPDYGVNVSGAVREWQHPDFADNDHHRHQSHVYPLFPGWEHARSDRRSIFAQAINNRISTGFSDQTSWSLMNMCGCYARLQDGENALRCMDLTARAMLMGNLLTVHNDWRGMGIGMNNAWAPFQIDANMGWTAGVQEMLAFSCEDRLDLFCALPARWRSGRFLGLGTRCGVTADLEWSERGRSAVLTAARDTRFLLSFPGRAPEWIDLKSGQTLRLSTAD